MPVFDTHGFVTRLVAAGMPERQAETLAQEQIQFLAEQLVTKEVFKHEFALLRADLLVTKEEFKQELVSLRADLLVTKEKFKDEFALLRAEIKAGDDEVRTELRELESRIYIRVGAMTAAMLTVLFAALKLS